MAERSDDVRGEKFHARRMDGYVHMTWADNVEIQVADAREAIEAVRTLGHGTLVPVLVDVRSMRSIERAGRSILSTTDVATKVAIFVRSPLSRTIGGFFLGLNKPARPMRMFTDGSEAVAWLVDGS